MCEYLGYFKSNFPMDSNINNCTEAQEKWHDQDQEKDQPVLLCRAFIFLFCPCIVCE